MPTPAAMEMYTWGNRNLTQGAELTMKVILPVKFSISFAVKVLRLLWKD